MRIFLIIDETNFFHPEFVNELLQRIYHKDECVGAGLVVKIAEKSDLELYLKRHWYFLWPQEITKLTFIKATNLIRRLLLPRKTRNFTSVREVFEKHGIDYFPIEVDINTPEIIERIGKARPDVIVNSSSPIFKDPLLSLPTYCCLNRHSALLPAYGGLWPVFHAFCNGETEIGVSVHIMNETIDTGPVLAQKAILLEGEKNIFQLYKSCFRISSEVVETALEKVRNGDLSPVETFSSPSYFSHPSRSDWQKLRNKGGRFI